MQVAIKAKKIKNSHSADEAQRIAYANRDKQRKDWNEVKVGKNKMHSR